MRAIYEVQTVNRVTGADHWVRVEARDTDAARAKVIALGEMVGEVRLAEVLDDAGPVKVIDADAPPKHGFAYRLTYAFFVVLIILGLFAVVGLALR